MHQIKKGETLNQYVLEETAAILGCEIMQMLDIFDRTHYKDLGKKGDYTSNVAFKLAPILKKKPQEIAEILCERISEKRLFAWYWDRAEAKNGFINLYLSKDILIANLEMINETKPNKD